MDKNKLKESLNPLLTLIENMMRDNLIASGKGDSNLIKEIQLTAYIEGDELVINDESPEYSVFVDKGRSPGKQPPLQNIIEWCKRKSIPEEFAFPIAKKIGEEGIPATNYKDPLRNIGTFLDEFISPSIAEDIKNVLKPLNKI